MIDEEGTNVEGSFVFVILNIFCTVVQMQNTLVNNRSVDCENRNLGCLCVIEECWWAFGV